MVKTTIPLETIIELRSLLSRLPNRSSARRSLILETWERFCTFAREPEKRKVGIDARITVDGVAYEVEPDLAGEKVIIGVGFI